MQHKGWFAVVYFTGLRQSVGNKMKWGDVDHKHRVIAVSAKADKVGRERYLEGMPDRLWEVLGQLPEKDPNEPIIPSRNTVRGVMETARKAAKIADWPRNAMRRSFASHHLNFKNPDGTQDRLTTTLVVMCHTDKPDVFWKEYFRRSRSEWADDYFDVGLTAAEKKSLGIK